MRQTAKTIRKIRCTEDARKYLSIPTTSAPPERVFSLAGNVCSRRRVSLLPDHVDSRIYYFVSFVFVYTYMSSPDAHFSPAPERDENDSMNRKSDLFYQWHHFHTWCRLIQMCDCYKLTFATVFNFVEYCFIIALLETVNATFIGRRRRHWHAHTADYRSTVDTRWSLSTDSSHRGQWSSHDQSCSTCSTHCTGMRVGFVIRIES